MESLRFHGKSTMEIPWFSMLYLTGVTSCWCSHYHVDRDVWIGALSCWKTKSSPINSAASVSMCFSRSCWYVILSKRPSSFTRDPTPCEHIDPHTITLAVCWTVRSQHSGRNYSPLRRQTYRAPSFPMLTFDSSVKRTDFQSSKVHCVSGCPSQSQTQMVFC